MTSPTEPEKGQHPIKCSTCGKEYAHMTHLGGENLLTACSYCEGVENECPDCFLSPTEHPEGVEAIIQECLNTDDGLLNLDKYDHDRLRELLTRHGKEQQAEILREVFELEFEHIGTKTYVSVRDIRAIAKEHGLNL